MSEKPRHPKLEIETNIPVTIVLGKMFYKGNNEHGEFFGYNLTHEGSEKVFFASAYLHDQLKQFKIGDTLNVTKRQKAGEKSVSWEISSPNQNGHTTRELKYEPSTFNRDAYREQRVERMKQALDDAARVIESLGENEAKFEDLRSIAISFVIEENRDRVPLNPVEKTPDADIPVLLESIKKELTGYIPGQSEIDQTAKGQLLEKAFGVTKWQPVTQMNGEQLIEGLVKLKDAIAQEQTETDEIPF